MTFRERLQAAQERNRSLLCIGLDPDPELLQGRHVVSFLQAIIEATLDLVCCYKPNLAFFEALGPGGMSVLQEALAPVPPQIPVIADAKRADVPSVSRLYARALFEVYGFDAVTVHPYGGGDSLLPFLEYAEKGVFVWCRGSNPGAADVQSLPLADGRPLFLAVAELVRGLDQAGNAGLVVGATAPEDMALLRRTCPHMPFLVPGIGPQGGDLQAAVREGLDAQGGGLVVVAARQVLYASRGDDFAQAARRQALALREEINRLRAQALARGGRGW
jgi:orotidine-5'-phosphate decarboxylase